MKKSMIMILAVVVMGISLMPVGAALGDQLVHIPYVTQGSGWYTGIAVTNLTNSTINIQTTFIHKNGSINATTDRVGWGDLGPYEMKVYSLDEIYNLGKDPAVPLPDNRFSLYIYHLNNDEQFGVAVFIVNDLTGIGGYGFQQFYSETFVP